MARASQSNPPGGQVSAASQHYITEGTPPTSTTAIAWNGTDVEMHPPKPFVAYLYGKAVTQDLTVVLFGRLKVTGVDENGDKQTVTGDWAQLATNTFTAGATGSFFEVKLAEFVAAPNEFKLHWSAPATGGATSQAGVTFA